MQDGFLLTIHDHIATITLNRPEKHNAFDDLIIEDLRLALQQIKQHDKARVLVLKANGKYFSAGADLSWMKAVASYSEAENFEDSKKLAQLMYELNHFPLPTIAVVQGPAFGGGVGLITCCDIVLSTLKASFCFSEVRLGLVPAVISPYIIASIGARAARRYCLTAEAFGAECAHDLGLVSEIQTEQQIELRCEELCKHLIANGPKAVMTTKALLHDVANSKLDERLIDKTAKCIAKARVSEEGQEGLTAFLSKRAPNFS